MNYKRKSMSGNFSSLISSLVILMLVAVVVGFLFYRTDGLTTGYKEFYIQCGDDKIYGDRDNFNIVIGKSYKFELKNEIDNIMSSESNYSVNVIPNKERNFEFLVDDEEKQFSDLVSLSDYFNISIGKDFFTLTSNLSLDLILKDYFNTDNISNCPDSLNTGIPYFTIVVEKIDSGDVINICFNILDKYSLVINPIDNSDELEHINFSIGQIVLTNEHRSFSFGFEIDENYGFNEVRFDCDYIVVDIVDNVCFVSLEENYSLVENNEINLLFSVMEI